MNDDTRPDIPALLPVTAIRSYMRAAGWTEGFQGSHGSVFTRDGFKASVPLEDDDPDMTRMALYRLAVAEKREPGETEAAVRAYRDARLSGPVSRPVSDDSGQATSAAQPQPREHAGADVRERLGRLVHQERLDAEAERAEAEGRRRFLLEPWGERTEWQRELDMRIGHAVANYALTENAITWGTSCTSCARVLDSAYAETVRREAAEAKLAEVRKRARMWAGLPDRDFAAAGHAVLAIIGTGQEADHG